MTGEKAKWPELLLVAGMCRNAGKTTFVCRILEHFGAITPITAVKITPHFHVLDDEMCILYQCDDFIIARETKREREKDTGKMLESGATEVLYVQIKGDSIEGLPKVLKEFIPEGRICVAESSGLYQNVEPALLVLMGISGNETKNNLLKNKANWLIYDYNYSVERIEIVNGNWILKDAIE